MGPEVNVAHRLLKNNATQLVASSGAHLTKYANITDMATGQKLLIVDDAVVPPRALFDYAVTASTPPALTTDGALDGVSHCLEVFMGLAGPALEQARPVCLKGIELIVHSIKACCADPGSLPAREALGLGTDLGGYAIMIGGTNGAHLTSFSLVDILPHGRACAVMNPYYVVFFAPAIEEKLRAVAAIYRDAGYLKADAAALKGRDLGIAVAEAMIALSKDVGFPATLGEVPGFTDAHVARALAAAKNPQLESKLKNMPVPLSAGLVAGLGRVHAILMRRLSTGAALGRERTSAHRTGWRLDWPGPTALWGLVRKDALYLWRSPLTRRTIIFTPLFTLFMSVLFLAPFSSRPFPTTPEVREWLPLIVGAGWPVFLTMIVNVQFIGNLFGAVDREGFGTIAYSGVDRRLVLGSASLVAAALALPLYMVPIVASVAFTGLWTILPIGLATAIMIQVAGSPGYLLASIMGPFRAQWKMGGTNQSGGLWSLLVWLIMLPLAVVFVALPYALYRPALWATLPLGLALSGAAFWFALRPLARLMLRREQQILTTVFKED